MRELDVVKIKQTITGDDVYLGTRVTVPAGTDGTIVLAGDDGGEVEFILYRLDGTVYSAVLTLDYDQVDLVWEAPR